MIKYKFISGSLTFIIKTIWSLYNLICARIVMKRVFECPSSKILTQKLLLLQSKNLVGGGLKEINLSRKG